MRELHECQAEVFRRSEKRIKQRKQRRKHVLMGCIPLVLCISLLWVFVLSDRMAAGSKNSGAADALPGELLQDAYASFSGAITKITVSGSDFSKTYTDISKVLPISDKLYSYSTRGAQNNSETNYSQTEDEVIGEGHKENTGDVFGSGAGSANAGYTITLFTDDGEKIAYLLAGNTLKNLTENRTHFLTEKQVNELKDLLGIPHS